MRKSVDTRYTERRFIQKRNGKSFWIRVVQYYNIRSNPVQNSFFVFLNRISPVKVNRLRSLCLRTGVRLELECYISVYIFHRSTSERLRISRLEGTLKIRFFEIVFQLLFTVCANQRTPKTQFSYSPTDPSSRKTLHIFSDSIDFRDSLGRIAWSVYSYRRKQRRKPSAPLILTRDSNNFAVEIHDELRKTIRNNDENRKYNQYTVSVVINAFETRVFSKRNSTRIINYHWAY